MNLGVAPEVSWQLINLWTSVYTGLLHNKWGSCKYLNIHEGLLLGSYWKQCLLHLWISAVAVLGFFYKLIETSFHVNFDFTTIYSAFHSAYILVQMANLLGVAYYIGKCEAQCHSRVIRCPSCTWITRWGACVVLWQRGSPVSHPYAHISLFMIFVLNKTAIITKLHLLQMLF